GAHTRRRLAVALDTLRPAQRRVAVEAQRPRCPARPGRPRSDGTRHRADPPAARNGPELALRTDPAGGTAPRRVGVDVLRPRGASRRSRRGDAGGVYPATPSARRDLARGGRGGRAPRELHRRYLCAAAGCGEGRARGRGRSGSGSALPLSTRRPAYEPRRPRGTRTPVRHHARIPGRCRLPRGYRAPLPTLELRP